MLFNHLLTLSPNYYNTHSTGDLMAHATNDIDAVRASLGQGIIMFVDAIFLTTLSVIMMIKTTNLKLTIIALFTLPFITIAVGKFGKLYTNVSDRFKKLSPILQILLGRIFQEFEL